MQYPGPVCGRDTPSITKFHGLGFGDLSETALIFKRGEAGPVGARSTGPIGAN
jgi:hypothetical protein